VVTGKHREPKMGMDTETSATNSVGDPFGSLQRRRNCQPVCSSPSHPSPLASGYRCHCSEPNVTRSDNSSACICRHPSSVRQNSKFRILRRPFHPAFKRTNRIKPETIDATPSSIIHLRGMIRHATISDIRATCRA